VLAWKSLAFFLSAGVGGNREASTWTRWYDRQTEIALLLLLLLLYGLKTFVGWRTR